MWAGGHGQIICRCFLGVPTEVLNEDRESRALAAGSVCCCLVLPALPGHRERALTTSAGDKQQVLLLPGSDVGFGEIWGFFSLQKACRGALELWDQQLSAKGASQILPQQQDGEDKKGSGGG